MHSFKDYCEHKIRQTIHHLSLLSKMFKHYQFNVDDFLNESNYSPYIYVYSPYQDSSFAGIRIYKIGEILAYRIQREKDTHPFGESYQLDLESLFDNLIENGVKKEVLGAEVAKMIVHQISRFFKESFKADRENNKDWGDDKDSALGAIAIMNPMGGDYSSLVFNKRD